MTLVKHSSRCEDRAGERHVKEDSLMRLLYVMACVVGCVACEFPRPADVTDDGGAPPTDSAGGGSNGDDAMSKQVCTPNQTLRCDAGSLVRCKDDGTAEQSESCALGCSSTEVRCNDIAPSNGLAPQLDMTAGEPDLDLGTTATINTDDGTVMVDGNPIVVRSTIVGQTEAPVIRVFIVRSLAAADVTVTGSNALAIVSNGDVSIRGTFAASAHAAVPGPGRFNNSTCQGNTGIAGAGGAFAGSGGGGFGSSGGSGGSATNERGTAAGGAGGSPTGNPLLIPLRGGCDAGPWSGGSSFLGTGGGAIQFVSRTGIFVTGVVAANGSSQTGGGSGGGILLEAPVVQVAGKVVANGGAGADVCLGRLVTGEDGRLDATPAIGAAACDPDVGSQGGNGAAGSTAAGAGISHTVASAITFPGGGGGGVGRIRVNTASGGVDATGVFSPGPSTGTIGTR
jgi:hypothetical protein